MAQLPKGIKRVIRRGADGEITGVYYYAWVSGPRLQGKPGSREFKASYAAALKGQKRQLDNTLAGLALEYQASPEFTGLADSTQKEWRRRISKIVADQHPKDIGGIPIEALNDPRVKADILAWRDQWAHTPRAADYLMQVLSRILSWGQQRGKLAANVAVGLGQLYHGNRADQIWSEDEVTRYVAAASSPEIGFVVPLARLVGLRLADLNTLAWSEVGDDAIIKVTAKGRGRRTAVIPLLAETRDLLGRIRAQQIVRNAELTARAMRLGQLPPPLPLTVLSNTFGRSWRYSGLETRIGDTKAAAAPPIDKHLHDARGTLATRLRKAGLTAPEIADVLGWDEKRVERLLAIYVDRNSIVKDIAARIQRLEAEARGERIAIPTVATQEVIETGHVQHAGAGVVHHVDFYRRTQARSPVHNAEPISAEINVMIGGQLEKRTLKRALIDLCAYVASAGVERRSPLVSDAWLGAELARDPWLFRTVEFEPGYHSLPANNDVVRWPISDDVAGRMWNEVKAANG